MGGPEAKQRSLLDLYTRKLFYIEADLFEMCLQDCKTGEEGIETAEPIFQNSRPHDLLHLDMKVLEFTLSRR
jgi:hypothetical protein